VRERVALLVGDDPAITAALRDGGFDVRSEGDADVVVVVPPPPNLLDDLERDWEAPMARAIEVFSRGGNIVFVAGDPDDPVAEAMRLLALSGGFTVSTPELVAFHAS
jgi:hypothetical protein